MKIIYKIEFNSEEKEYLEKLLKLWHPNFKNRLFKCEEDCEYCPFYRESTGKCIIGSLWNNMKYIAEVVENV